MPYLQFKGKTAVETYHHAVPHHALEFDGHLSVLQPEQQPSLDGNLIIEGDNLLALKSLLPTHAGRIKCIYIDPPYNTGNEEWVYNDNLTQPQFKEWIGQVVGKEGEDATRHDKWCCMMYPRLHLLRELLTEDGAIFVSIDDNELKNLFQLMDEVYNPSSFIACMVWKSRQYPDARAKTGVSNDHEYIVVYSKQTGGRLRGGERDESKYANPDNDPRGPWMSRSMLGLAPKERRPNLHYGLIEPGTGREFEPPPDTGWRYHKETMQRKIADGRILFPADDQGRPREKVFLYELQTKYPGLPSVIVSPYTADGTQEIREIFGSGVFSFPKPSSLIRDLVEQATEEEAIVLDNCAGSGTTAQAVLQLNSEDGGNRKFILVQQKHDTKEDRERRVNICQTITAERVRRVIQGYAYEGNQTETLLEEKIGLNALKKADELLARIEAARAEGRERFDDVRAEMKEGVVRVEGIRRVMEKTEGLGGTFTYARVGEKPLFGEYRDLGETLPAYEEIAKYVFYTETSREWNPARMERATGKIGEHAGTSYYLLYEPAPDADRALDTAFLADVAVRDPNAKLVVYCEKFWMHRDELRRWESEAKKTLRRMQVPFNLK